MFLQTLLTHDKIARKKSESSNNKTYFFPLEEKTAMIIQHYHFSIYQLPKLVGKTSPHLSQTGKLHTLNVGIL